MSRRPSERASCAGKKSHDSAAAARKHRARLIGQGAAEWRLHVYRCVHCPAWHVGHTRAPKGKT